MKNKVSLHSQQFGKTRIFRPRHQTVLNLRAEGKATLLERFSPAAYDGREKANPAIHCLFDFYDQKLRTLAPLLASRGFVDFLLFQYDEATAILHGKGITDPEERAEWSHIEGSFKKAIKYIVELLCIEQEPVGCEISDDDALFAAETALACAEAVIYLSEMSNRIHLIFPDSCRIVVHDQSSPEDLTIKIIGRNAGYDARFQRRVILDRKNRDRFIPLETQFDVNPLEHIEHLDPAFLASFGMSYSLFLAGLRAVIEGSFPAGPGHLPTLFVQKAEVLRQLQQSNRPLIAIEAMLDGFTITSSGLIMEKRVVWNTKQASRAFRRGFFNRPHETGDHLAFSREMAKESFHHMISGVCFQKVPPEWATPLVKKALASLSNAAGKWFEATVTRHLTSSGYIGRQFKSVIKSEAGVIRIPHEVGELDFLGYHPDKGVILLVEAKMTLTGLEAQFWSDDIQQFVTGKKPFAERFRKKRRWVTENLEMISKILGVPASLQLDARMLTLYPCIAAEFIEDFPCESITEFLLGRSGIDLSASDAY